jgi:nucleoid-associated protein YgaU
MGPLDNRSGREEGTERDKPDYSNVKSGSSSTASSGVQSGSSSTAPRDVPVEQQPTAESAKKYTVVAGDSLSEIARREYGSANEWQRIYEANKDIIKNPDLIYPGQQLTIPRR